MLHLFTLDMTIISNIMPDDELDVPKLDFSLAKFTKKRE